MPGHTPVSGRSCWPHCWPEPPSRPPAPSLPRLCCLPPRTSSGNVKIPAWPHVSFPSASCVPVGIPEARAGWGGPQGQQVQGRQVESPHEIPEPRRRGASPPLPGATSQSWEVPGTHSLLEGRPHQNSHGPGARPPPVTPEARPFPETRGQAPSKPWSCWAALHTNLSPMPSCAPFLQTCRPLLCWPLKHHLSSPLASTWKPAVSYLRRPARHPGESSVHTSNTFQVGTYPTVGFPPSSADPVLLGPPEADPQFTTPGLLTPG